MNDQTTDPVTPPEGWPTAPDGQLADEQLDQVVGGQKTCIKVIQILEDMRRKIS